MVGREKEIARLKSDLRLGRVGVCCGLRTKASWQDVSRSRGVREPDPFHAHGQGQCRDETAVSRVSRIAPGAGACELSASWQLAGGVPGAEAADQFKRCSAQGSVHR